MSQKSEVVVDAKGDMLIGKENNLAARLGVGDDGAVLTADSTTELGVAWSGGYAAVVQASGDTSGLTDAATIDAAIDAAEAAGGGTVTLGGGSWYIDSRVTVPDGVNLWGQGSGEESAATRIYCTDAAAGIAFGTRTTGGRGGLSGNFCVHGDSLATEPLFIGMTVQRTFVSMESTRSAGNGIVFEATQNCTFVGCHVSHAAGIDVVFDYSAAGNRFYGFEVDSAGTWFVKFQQSGAAPEGLHAEPFDNQFYGGICERVATEGGIWQAAGDGNAFHDFQVVHDETDETFDFVRLDSGELCIDGGLIQSNAAGQGTAFNVASGATLVIAGEPTVAGVSTVYDNDGSVDLNGFLRAVSYETYLTGTAPNEKVSHGYAGLGSLPILAAAANGLGASLAAIPGSWWRLDPSSWPAAPNGRSLRYRLRFLAMSATAGDAIGAILYDATNSVGMFAEATKAAAADGMAEVVSDWQDFPASAVGGYVMARNATAARGSAVSACIEVAVR